MKLRSLVPSLLLTTLSLGASLPTFAATNPTIEKTVISQDVTKLIPKGSNLQSVTSCGDSVFLEWTNTNKKQYLVQVFQGKKEKTHVIDTQWTANSYRVSPGYCLNDGFYVSTTFQPTQDTVDYTYGNTTGLSLGTGYTTYQITLSGKKVTKVPTSSLDTYTSSYGFLTVEGIRQKPGYLQVSEGANPKSVYGSSQIAVMEGNKSVMHTPPWFKDMATSYVTNQDGYAVFYRIKNGYRVVERVGTRKTPTDPATGLSTGTGSVWDDVFNIYEIHDGEAQYKLINGNSISCPYSEYRELRTKEEGRALMVDSTKSVSSAFGTALACTDTQTSMQSWNIHMLTPGSNRRYFYSPSTSILNASNSDTFSYLVVDQKGKSALWKAKLKF